MTEGAEDIQHENNQTTIEESEALDNLKILLIPLIVLVLWFIILLHLIPEINWLIFWFFFVPVSIPHELGHAFFISLFTQKKVSIDFYPEFQGLKTTPSVHLIDKQALPEVVPLLESNQLILIIGAGVFVDLILLLLITIFVRASLTQKDVSGFWEVIELILHSPKRLIVFVIGAGNINGILNLIPYVNDPVYTDGYYLSQLLWPEAQVSELLIVQIIGFLAGLWTELVFTGVVSIALIGLSWWGLLKMKRIFDNYSRDIGEGEDDNV